MESKVLLFNERDVRVGETYMRRARQLVNQQRAHWMDESHSAIRFVPDEDLVLETPLEEKPSPLYAFVPDEDLGARTPLEEKPKPSALYAIAEKRIQERKRFLLHTLAFIPELLLIWQVFGVSMWAWEFACFLSGVVTTVYVFHAREYVRRYVRGFRVPDREKRRTRRLAMEVARLERMGYVK